MRTSNKILLGTVSILFLIFIVLGLCTRKNYRSTNPQARALLEQAVRLKIRVLEMSVNMPREEAILRYPENYFNKNTDKYEILLFSEGTDILTISGDTMRVDLSSGPQRHPEFSLPDLEVRITHYSDTTTYFYY